MYIQTTTVKLDTMKLWRTSYMFRHFQATFREAFKKNTGLFVYFYWLYATLTVAEKDRHISEVCHTLFTIACNYTPVVDMCVVTFLTARDTNNFKSGRKIVYL